MKAILIIFFIGMCLCQLAPNTAINSCGKVLDSKQPATADDCKPGGEHNLCCFVSIPDKNIQYCAFMPNTKLEDEVVSDFKTIISKAIDGKDATVVCNSSNSLSGNIIIMISCLFSIFFF